MQLMSRWWKRQKNQKHSPRRQLTAFRQHLPRRPSRCRTYKPWAECLEGRVAPTVNWINPAGGDWDSASNWSTGLVPGTNDDVVISQSGITVTHAANVGESINSLNSQANINWQSGSLSLASNSSVSGTFNNAGSVIIQGGSLALNGGGTDSGSFTVINGALSLGGTWSNSGTATLTGSTLNLSGSGTWTGSSLNADSASTVEFYGNFTTAGGNVALSGGGHFGIAGATLSNSTLTLDAGQALVADYGSSDLSNLTLNGNLQVTLSASYYPYNSGVLAIFGGLTLNGTLYLGAADGSTYDDIFFYGTQSVGGTGDIVFGGNSSNQLYLAGATTVTFGPNFMVHGAHGFVNVATSNSSFVNQGTLTADVVGGEIDVGGQGSLVNSGRLAATGGYLNINAVSWSSTGPIQATSGGTVRLQNSGTSSGALTAQTNGVVAVRDSWSNSGAVLAQSGGVVVLGESGGSSGSNSGSLNATGGTINFGGTWSNSVSQSITGGRLNLGGSGTWTGASISTDATSTVEFYGNFTTAGGNVVLSGGGHFGIAGATLSNSTLTLDAGQALVADYGSSDLSNLTLNGNLQVTLSASYYPYSSGVLAIFGGLTLNGTLYLGAADGSTYDDIFFYGTQSVGGTGDIVFGGNSSNQLYLAGATTVTFGPNFMVHGAHGFVNVATSNSSYVNQGTIAADVSGGEIAVGGPGSLANSGQLTATAGFLYIAPAAWSSTATIEATNGSTVQLVNSGTSSGSVTAQSNGLIAVGGSWNNSAVVQAQSGGVVLLGESGSSGSNTGSLNASGGTIGFGGTWSNSGTATLTAGTLNLGGNGTWTATGIATDVASRVDFNSSFTTNDGTVALAGNGSFELLGGSLVNGIATLGPNARMLLNGGTLNNFTVNSAGAVAYTGGTITFSNGASFTNATTGTFDDRVDGTFGGNGSDCPVFNNQGLFIKSGGTGTTNLQMELFNTGTVTVQTGNLNLGCGYVQAPPSGGSGSSGTISGNITGSVSNPGQLTVAPAPTPPPTLTGYSQTVRGVLNEEIGGYTAGTQYGQLIVTGAVNLAGALNVTLINGFTPHLNDQFEIINNQSASSISGTFTGLAEGALVWDTRHSYSFTISYVGGDGNDVVLTAQQTATTTAVAASVNPSVLNQSVTFTATVTPASGSGTPTGTVQFQIDGVNIGAAVSLTSGSASFNTSTLTVGTHTITALYSGSGNYLASTGSLTETVLSAQQQISVIGNQVNSLVNAALLSSGNGTALTAKLNAATASLSGGHTNAAVNQLRAFINQVNAFVASGTLSSAQGQALTSAAKAAIAAANGAGSFQLSSGASSAFVSSNSNQILNGLLTVSVQDDTGNGLDPNEVARITDAMTYLNSALGSFGVYLSWAVTGTSADVHIHFASTTPQGSASDGVLGFTTADNNVYFVSGWNIYTGVDAGAIGAGQYDFLTLATHELAHTVGLGESIDPNSVMYEYLPTGTVRRTFTDANLTLINTDADRYMKAGAAFRGAGNPNAGTGREWLAGALGNVPASGSGVTLSGAGINGPALGTFGSSLLDRPPVLGNSSARVDAINRDAWLYGGSGSKSGVLVGGNGDDLVIGGSGRDLLIGGFGGDRPLHSGVRVAWTAANDVYATINATGSIS